MRNAPCSSAIKMALPSGVWIDTLLFRLTGRESLRPVLTGWYSEYGTLSATRREGVNYAEGPLRWAGFLTF
jgi:hypothetical protein